MSIVKRLLTSIGFAFAVCSCATAGIVKTDLRSKASSQQFFVVFCAARNTPNQAYAGLAVGSVDSEYQWSEVISYSTSKVFRAEQGVTVPVFDSCTHNALVDTSSLFIAAVDESVFKTAKGLLNHNSTLTQTQKPSDLFQKDAASVSSAAGLHIPDSTSSALEFVNQLSVFNPGRPQDGVEWVWQPPVVRMVTVPESAPANPATPSNAVSTQEQSHDNFISTGVSAIPQIDRAALLRLYQAVADAEDNPNLYYDVELQIEDRALVKVFVHPLELRHDPPIEKGDSACFYFAGDPTNADPIDLLNHLLQLSNTNATEISKSWGFYPAHPLLGSPRNWQAAVTSVPACYLSATPSAEFVSRIAPTPHLTYAATIIRGFAAYPRDKGVFNSNAPVQMLQPDLKTTEMTNAEKSWRTYRSYVEQLKSYAQRRSGSYPGLSQPQIALRRTYDHDAQAEDELFFSIRKDFALREIGWDQFLNNKLKGLQDGDYDAFTKGVPTIYNTIAKDASNLEPAFNLAPFLTQFLASYKSLMSISILSKQVDVAKYNPDLTIRGDVCKTREADCARLAALLKPAIPEPVGVSLGAQNQTKFDNVIDIGVVSIAAPQTDPIASFNVANSVCQVRDSGTLAQSGTVTATVALTNKLDRSLALTFAHAGSWTEATWAGADSANIYEKELAPGDSANMQLKFLPGKGYQDLNIVYVLENGKPLAQFTIDYLIAEDPIVKILSIQSPGLQSGASDGWLNYDLAVAKVPSLYSVREACVWVSGDRNDCKHTQWSTCGITSLTNDLVGVTFGLQGHTDDPSAKRLSSGYLWVAYQLVSNSLTLR